MGIYISLLGTAPITVSFGSHESNPLTEVLVPRSLRPNEHPLMACVAVLAAWRCSWRCAKLHWESVPSRFQHRADRHGLRHRR